MTDVELEQRRQRLLAIVGELRTLVKRLQRECEPFDTALARLRESKPPWQETAELSSDSHYRQT